MSSQEMKKNRKLSNHWIINEYLMTHITVTKEANNCRNAIIDQNEFK